MSSGLGHTTPPRPPAPPRVPPDDGNRRHNNEVVIYEAVPAGIAIGGSMVAEPEPPEPPHGRAHIEAYIGASKIHESDGMWNAEVALRDGVFRLAGSYTQYYEAQRGGQNLTMSLPALVGGFRIDDRRGPTRAYLELGLVGAKTRNDPVMDTSLTGGIGGVRLEHRIAHQTSLIGTAHELVFEQGVRAHSASVGLRVGMLQATFRVLDFNVGPALYGPEIGLRF